MRLFADENFPRPAVAALREAGMDRGLPSDCGIILFRLTPQDPDEVAALAATAIGSQPSWTGYFSVVTRQKIRMRPLPSAGRR